MGISVEIHKVTLTSTVSGSNLEFENLVVWREEKPEYQEKNLRAKM